jgi:ribonuclease P protein component
VNEFRFPKGRRVLKTAEFDQVFERRRSQSDGMLVLYGRENGLNYARLGLVVSRKAGNAVQRTRWKRCLREAFRLAQHELPPGIDLVAMPRAGAVPTMPRVRESLVSLAARLVRRLESS